MGAAALGYDPTMRYKLVFGAGIATGYYLGAKAGRARYEQIQHRLESIRRNPRVEAVTERISNAVDAQLGKAKEAVASTVRTKVGSAVATARNTLPLGSRDANTAAPHSNGASYSSSR